MSEIIMSEKGKLYNDIMFSVSKLIEENSEKIKEQIVYFYINEILKKKEEDFEKDETYKHLFFLYFRKKQSSPQYKNYLSLNDFITLYYRIIMDYEKLNKFYKENIMNKDKDKFSKDFLKLLEELTI